jgi:hypothetical protein
VSFHTGHECMKKQRTFKVCVFSFFVLKLGMLIGPKIAMLSCFMHANLVIEASC